MWGALLAALGAVAACEPRASSEAAAAASVRAVPDAASASPEPRAWFEGRWSGDYEERLEPAEVSGSAVQPLSDATAARSTGSLSLEARTNGGVSGSASGGLGEQRAVGEFLGERLTLLLVPQRAGGYRGVLIAERRGEELVGSLNASTGDGLSVRTATVSLRRAP
jgi:hypothetical protein